MSLDSDLKKLPKQIRTIEDYMPQMVIPQGIVEITFNGSGKGIQIFHFGGVLYEDGVDKDKNPIKLTYLLLSQSGIQTTQEGTKYIFVEKPTQITEDITSIKLK